jgi:hypothetical protein
MKLIQNIFTMCIALAILAPSGAIGLGTAGKRVSTLPQTANPLITEIINKIDSQSIHGYIQDLQDFGTRYAKSQQSINASIYIHNKFSADSGLQVSYDQFPNRGMTMQNVVAVLPGENKSSTTDYIISGHYDSIVQSGDPFVSAPGADDDGSGTAITMETARIMSQYRYEDTIIFATWDSEELGLNGSAHYASDAKTNGMNIGAVVTFDQSAHDTQNKWGLLIWDFPRSTWLRTTMYSVNTTYNIGLVLSQGPPSDRSDHASFDNNGYSAVMCREKDGSLDYHATTDTIDKLNMEFAAKSARLGAATVAQLARIIGPSAVTETYVFVIILLPGAAMMTMACVVITRKWKTDEY